MTTIRDGYLRAAASAAALLRDSAVGAAWHQPSALPEFSVRGLAGHLAAQVLLVPRALAQDVPDDEPISLLEHYARAKWVGADLNDEINVRIRSAGEEHAADGPAALVEQTEAAVRELRHRLPAEPADRVVHFPPGPWSLYFDDFLTTRMLEIAVHSDDLAVSLGVETPTLPPGAIDPVLALLSQLAVHRHGQPAVLRAFSRAERTPATIAAI
ncbi:MAG: hypothetical protein GEU98_15770 [Pseudonocardiaceae bacterium]|nr:hypothetical protein [Pseudonocardiaceae bacterium]